MSERKLKPPAERKITPRLLKFAHEYARCGNGREAARAAGYAGSYAEARGYRMLQDPRVQEEIAKIQSAAAKSAEVTAAEVLRELKAIAFSDLGEFVKWKGGKVTLIDSETLSTEQRRLVAEVKKNQMGVGIKLHDKMAALTLLAKHLGMLVDKVEHSGEVKTQAPVINLTLTAPAKVDGSG